MIFSVFTQKLMKNHYLCKRFNSIYGAVLAFDSR